MYFPWTTLLAFWIVFVSFLCCPTVEGGGGLSWLKGETEPEKPSKGDVLMESVNTQYEDRSSRHQGKLVSHKPL